MSQGGALEDGAGGGPIGNARFPITPYVVGPSGQAGYQTVQSAINAANAAGGGTVWIQPGSYTENLTFFDGTTLVGDNNVEIVGIHTIPASANISVTNIAFTTTTDVFNYSGASGGSITASECVFSIDQGYVFNLPLYTGVLTLNGCFNGASTDNGILNNTVGARLVILYSIIGNGTLVPANIAGDMTIIGSTIACQINSNQGAHFIYYSVFIRTFVFSGVSQAVIKSSHFYPASLGSGVIAITTTASAPVSLYDCTVDSNATTVITGTGIVVLGNVTFPSNSTIDPSIALNNGSLFTSGQVAAGADIGGRAHFTSLTNANTSTIGAGTGTVKMSSANSANNAVWIKIYVGTTAYWIPAWTTNAP